MFIDSLQKLLLNMLSYTYNYNRNFEGADYDDKGKPKNKGFSPFMYYF
ncbi:hypothetical protein SHM_02580 [Spiroplasma ixodetis]|uniref:Spiroplasmavirus-related protein n=1 Tax=Spiroplasma ixodetis TaxID=2141 RepID=A0ABM8BRX9_9MOLU|nr:hypothetical protein SHM_02580 [Spiroplasma ixodetis]